MDKLMVEAAINELSTKEQNPHVPYGPEEVARDAIACAKAGAAIVHFHARDSRTGGQLWTSAETYVEAFHLIRKECDVILYPTYPADRSKEERIAHVLALAEHPEARLELATLDLGSTNTGGFDPAAGRLRAGTYVNSHRDMVYFMEQLKARGVTYSLGVRDVGQMRHIEMYRDMGLVKDPISVKIFLSDWEARGPYPDARGLMMYLDMIPRGMTCHWFTLIFNSVGDGAAFRRVSMLAAAMGGHIRTGLGDNPRLDGRPYTNAEQVQIAVDMAHHAGREVATPAEARHMMGMVG